MADAPHPPGPAEGGRGRAPRRAWQLAREESLLLGGVTDIFAVTLAALALSVCAGLIALGIALVF